MMKTVDSFNMYTGRINKLPCKHPIIEQRFFEFIWMSLNTRKRKERKNKRAYQGHRTGWKLWLFFHHIFEKVTKH